MSTRISTRLRQLRDEKGLSQAKFARRLGMKDYQIRDMERGKTSPSAEMLSAVVEKFEVDAEWLLAGRSRRAAEDTAEYEAPARMLSEEELADEVRRRLLERMPATHEEPVLIWGDQSKVERKEALQNYRAVPLVVGRAAAGHGEIVDEEIESWALIHDAVVPAGHEVRAVRVSGDSMAPLLPEGAIVAIDFDRADPREADGRIVAARHEEGVVVKWWIHHDDHIVLESQNPAWAPIYLDPGEEATALLGEVVWAWQDFRGVRRRQ